MHPTPLVSNISRDRTTLDIPQQITLLSGKINNHSRRERSSRLFFLSLLFCFLFPLLSFAGQSYQDFEPDNGSDIYGWSWNAAVSFSSACEPVHSGSRSWKLVSAVNWGGTGIQSQTQRWDFNTQPAKNDRLIFYIYALPFSPSDNNVGVKFFDRGLYRGQGFEVWTTNTAQYGKWTKLSVLFSQLPPDFDLQHIDKIEFVNFWPGTYYLDDIAVVRQDRVYQAFEPQLRSGSTAGEYGWKWNEKDVVRFSKGGEPVKEGSHSWKLISKGKWGGTGIQSQEKRYWDTPDGPQQSFWNVDLDPLHNDRLTFWVYTLAKNGLDNNLGVQFYDHEAHFTDETKIVVWTKKSAVYGRWTKLSIPFKDLFKDPQSSLNLRDLNKIQFQFYWPGTYYLDDVRATGPLVEIDQAVLAQGLVQWEAVSGAEIYTLQESLRGPSGPWTTIYTGAARSFQTKRLTRAYFRVRWQEAKTDQNSLPYLSDWSDTAEYHPLPVLIRTSSLKEGLVGWRPIPQAEVYELQVSSSKRGPWKTLYKGQSPEEPIIAELRKWYRVRAIRELNGQLVEAGDWSPAQPYPLDLRFIRAQGMVLRDGKGEVVIPRGVNLGGYLLIEKWLTGLGEGDLPNIEDDWNIRRILSERFGLEQGNRLLRAYQEVYIQESDLDHLLRMRVNFVRLPIFYRILQDDEGNWFFNEQGDIDFTPIDRVVNFARERGIYVLLDLHGAPGGQSKAFHTGRKDFNRLFKEDAEGEAYRLQTINLWKAIAEHYKDESMVLGYDLLNEPLGVFDLYTTKEEALAALWDFYDRLHDAIRKVDNKHIIVMEGVWDWDTLPLPATKDWQNIIYQFHYYLFGNDEDEKAHTAFIREKINTSRSQQKRYRVPVMIGEFNGFSLRSVWQNYLKAFNAEGYGWAMWNYKYYLGSSNWGLYLQTGYDEELPRFNDSQEYARPGDSLETLERKLNKYDTSSHHSANVSLSALLRKLSSPLSAVNISKKRCSNR